MGFVQAHGGFIAAGLLILAVYNIVFSALAQIFSALHMQEPGALQKLGAAGLKITQWLSANTPSPTASNVVSGVDGQVVQPPSASSK